MERGNLYFAYGSNMDIAQMDIRCPGGYKVLGDALLPDFKFIINQRGVANIIPQKESKVFGVLFNLNTTCLGVLDRYEGYPYFYTREKLPIEVKDKIFKPWVYIDKNALEIGKSRTMYLERIILAAESFNFPKDYVDYLKSFKL